MTNVVYTIGHSTWSTERFIGLLKSHGVTAVGDVRSQPYSRRNPQFNRDGLKEVLQEHDIAYVFLGDELGARSDDPCCYENGKVRYDRLALSGSFRNGLERVKKGAGNYRLALMCAEKEPLDCHRTILVARHLEKLGLEVQHILADGSLESHVNTIERLKTQLKLTEDMFKPAEAVVDEAYEIQGDRIAYELPIAPRNARADNEDST